MSISSQTVDQLKKFTKQVCCPLCGKDNLPIESLTSCGHFLCAECVDHHVLRSDQKCPKCYAFNTKTDVKDNNFLNTALKIAHKINKLMATQRSVH